MAASLGSSPANRRAIGSSAAAWPGRVREDTESFTRSPLTNVNPAYDFPAASLDRDVHR